MIMDIGSLVRDLLHPPAFLAHQLFQAFQHLGTHAGRIAGEVDQVTLSAFMDMKSETVPAVEGDQRSVDGLDAALIALLVTG